MINNCTIRTLMYPKNVLILRVKETWHNISKTLSSANANFSVKTAPDG